MNPVTIYTTQHCSYCESAKRLLASKGVTPVIINVEDSPEHLAQMLQRSRRRTVPQIFVRGSHIGGFDDLATLDHKGGFDVLLHA